MIKHEYRHVIGERLRRQRLVEPLESPTEKEEYVKLFAMLQPVSPVHNTRPGDPPKLAHRTTFEDHLITNELREKHRIVKGRFCGGRVGYVLQEDLERYAVVFRKPISTIKPIHEDILAIIRNSGGLSKEQLKQDLHYPAGEISKAMLSLQEAFLLYEDQPDTDWDTGWFDFATEWFEIRTDEDYYLQCVEEVIQRFIQAMVFTTQAQIKSWSSLPKKSIQHAITTLLEAGKVAVVEIAGLGQGVMGVEDAADLPALEAPPSAFMLDRSDFLVRAHIDELQQRYKGMEVLQFLLIDGEFKGSVLGHWRIGPYDVDDIVLELDSKQADDRKEEIIGAVRRYYSSERHAILKYNGIQL